MEVFTKVHKKAVFCEIKVKICDEALDDLVFAVESNLESENEELQACVLLPF